MVDNCFYCKPSIEKKCYVQKDNTCYWKIIADNDLKKFYEKKGIITLELMLIDYLKKEKDEGTRLLCQEEIDEILKK